jgi:hypothetical protein
MATPKNSVEHRFRVVGYGQDPLFLRRFWLNLVPLGSDPFSSDLLLADHGVSPPSWSPWPSSVRLRARYCSR